MKHFYKGIQGWTQFGQFYIDAINAAPARGAHFVEIGSWRGRSAAFMAVEIINSGKLIFFDCVDPWGDGGPYLRGKKVKNLWEQFLKNVAPVMHVVRPIRLMSAEAAPLYPDASLDFVLIDGSHEYEDVKVDLESWVPKVKPGGVIAGDDYGWPGVSQACDEYFGRYVGDGRPGKTRDHACWRVRINADGEPEPYRA